MSNGTRLRDTPVGRSIYNNTPLVNVIMTPMVDLHQPVRSTFIDMANINQPDFQEFVSWKTAEIAPYTPALTEIRKEVEDAWKTIKARDLARDEAEKLAEKLRKAGDDPWKSTLTTEQQTLLISPVPFTWMTPPRQMFEAPEITFVNGLDAVGESFMQQVFKSSAGQFVVAPTKGKRPITSYALSRPLRASTNCGRTSKSAEVGHASWPSPNAATYSPSGIRTLNVR